MRSLELNGLEEIHPDHDVQIKTKLRDLLLDNHWTDCSQALVLNEYMQRFVLQTAEGEAYRGLADILATMAGLLKAMFNTIDVYPYNVTLFHTHLDPREHDSNNVRQFLLNASYRDYVRNLVKQGSLSENIICEIQDWGYTLRVPGGTTRKARIMYYHSTSALALFAE